MHRLFFLVLALAFVVAAPGHAQDAPESEPKEKDKSQIDWVGDWEKAFKQAKLEKKVVMVCINSKDGEVANERAATGTYLAQDFVALSRKFVMMVVSTRDHSGMFGTCKRFKAVTCQQHVDCYKYLRNTYGDQFLLKGASTGDMISPQHAFFTSAGKLIFRKEYELTKPELMKRMRTVLAEASGKTPEEIEEEAQDGAEDQPLSEKDKAELARIGGNKQEHRLAAIGNLLRTGKRAAITALVDLLLESKKPAIQCDIIRGLGDANIVDARETIEGFLSNKEALVRSFSAVALEEIQQPASIEPLMKRAKKERDRYARKNMLRALGRCAGPTGHEKAAKHLLKAVTRDKQQMVRKHAALALRYYTGEKPSAVVRKKLESLASKEKDRSIRGALVYTLTYVGDPETTLAVFEKILAKVNNDISKQYMRHAIKVLKKRESWGRWAWFLYTEDRDDPARETEDNGRGRGGRGG